MNEMPSDGKPTDTTDAAAPRRASNLRIGLLALVAGIALGLAAVYGIGGFDGNADDGGKCRAATAAAGRLAPFATGDVAAFAPLAPARDLSGLAFADADGRPTGLSAWKGRVVLLNLWATWCVPCRREMPALDRLQRAAGSPDFAVVAVDLDTRDPEKPRAFLAEIGVTALAFHADPSLGSFKALQKLGLAHGLPTTLLIDRDGCGLGAMAGPAEWDGPAARALIAAAVGR